MHTADTVEERRRALRLAFCVSGIVSSLLVYGVLQERIMTQARLNTVGLTRAASLAAYPGRSARAPG